MREVGCRLTSEERDRLRQLIRSGQHSARVITRARILLKTDEGWRAAQVVAALNRSQGEIYIGRVEEIGLGAAN